MIKTVGSWLLPLTIILTACIPTPASLATVTVSPTETIPAAWDWNDFSIFEPGLIPSEQVALETQKGASIYLIDYTINKELAAVAGKQVVHYTNREEVDLGEVDVRLLPNVLNGRMQVSKVSVDGLTVDVTYALLDSLLRIPLDPELRPGESVDLGFTFTVNVPAELESNYGILAFYDNVLTLAHCFPMIAVYDDEGWNAEIPPDQGDPTYADASFFVVSVDAPSQVILAASGREVGREVNGDRQQVTYAAGPARDFYLAASPDYEVISKSVAGVTFNSYAPHSAEKGSQAALDFAIEAFQVFSERYALYPYTEFDIVATPTYALGVEYPGIVAITNRLYDLNGSLSEIPNSNLMESVVVHEAGHQWFYNLVGNDQLDESWLDESLTQFVTWQYYADRYGPGGASGFEGSLQARWSRVDNQPIPIGLPAVEYEGRSYGAIVYGRGAFFFEALRQEMGEQAFDAFLQEYARRYAWGIGTGDGMISLAEEYCACELSGLYEDWVVP